MLKEFDKVKLKSGEIGIIVDKLDDEDFYVDVVKKDTGETVTTFVSINDIVSVFIETEHPISHFAS